MGLIRGASIDGCELAKYFNWTALATLLVALGWTALVAIPNLNVSKIISGWSAGSWYFVAYVVFLVAGPVGNMVWASMYRNMCASHVYSKTLSALHIALYNFGAVVGALVLGYAGYIGGSMLLAKAETAEIHRALAVFVEPIGLIIVAGLLGAFLGVLNITVTVKGNGKKTLTKEA